uniref:Protein NATD1 n=1 Tax=Parascaris univalens TaxID=6257 RepID=A0A915AI85_PARUN
MAMKVTPLTVEHCAKSLEFFVRMNGARSTLQYRRLPNNVLDLYHTEVPPPFQA